MSVICTLLPTEDLQAFVEQFQLLPVHIAYEPLIHSTFCDPITYVYLPAAYIPYMDVLKSACNDVQSCTSTPHDGHVLCDSSHVSIPDPLPNSDPYSNGIHDHMAMYIHSS